MDSLPPIRSRQDVRRLSRRRLLQQTSALAAAGLLAGGLRGAAAQTPAATPGAGQAAPPANVRVSHDDLAIHVEPHVAVNPAQPDNLLGAAQVIPESGPTVVSSYASFDGGQSWQDNGPLPFPPGLNTDNDVTVAFDAAGHGFVAAMATSESEGHMSQTDRTVVVWRTDDGGRSFAPPVVAVGHQFVDHPWLAVDPAAGTLYLTWVTEDHEGAGFTRSTDGGATFDEPRVVATPPGRQIAKPVIAAGPRGAVHIAYETIVIVADSAAGGINAQIEVVGSADGGDTFGRPRAVARVPREPVLPGDVHLPTGPSLATDPSGGVSLAFVALRPATNRLDVMLAHAAGPGRPFGPPVRVSTAADGEATAYFQPRVVVDETGALAVTAFALKDGRVDVVLWRAASADGPFDAGRRITSEAFDPAAGMPDTKHGAWWIGDYQGLAAGGGVLHALWNDTRTGNLELFAAAIPIPTNAS
jgi:hypothetical protein